MMIIHQTDVKVHQADVIFLRTCFTAAMDGHPAKIPRIIYFCIRYVCIRVKST